VILRATKVEWRQWWARRDVRAVAILVAVAAAAWTWVVT